MMGCLMLIFRYFLSPFDNIIFYFYINEIDVIWIWIHTTWNNEISFVDASNMNLFSELVKLLFKKISNKFT